MRRRRCCPRSSFLAEVCSSGIPVESQPSPSRIPCYSSTPSGRIALSIRPTKATIARPCGFCASRSMKCSAPNDRRATGYSTVTRRSNFTSLRIACATLPTLWKARKPQWRFFEYLREPTRPDHRRIVSSNSCANGSQPIPVSAQHLRNSRMEAGSRHSNSRDAFGR